MTGGYCSARCERLQQKADVASIAEERSAVEDHAGWARHIRRESATRVKYKLQYPDLESIRRGDPPPEMGVFGVSWCDVDCSGEWMFQDIDHAVEALAHGTSVNVCRACLQATQAIINTELAEET